LAISGLVGAIYKASGTSTTFTAQAMTNSGDNKRYFITDRTKAYWDDQAALTLEKSTNGTTWSAVTSGFTVEYAGGYVEFAADQGTLQFRISSKSFALVAIGGGYNWSLDIESEQVECTNFNSNGWKEYTTTLNGFSGSFEKYWEDGASFSELGNESLILVLYVDGGASKLRYEGYARINTDSISSAVDGLVEESLDFQGSGKIYYRAG
jgi:hypothetical protein